MIDNVNDGMGLAREKVRAILFDRWNLDSIVGDPNDETIEETLDEIEAVYRNV